MANGNGNSQKNQMTQDQFNALVKSAGLGGGSSPSQLQDAFKLYQQNPQSINAMIGGTYTPGGAGTYGAAGHGVQTMGGGQVIGGVPFQTMANLLQGYVPQQQPQQQPQQPQMPQLSPAQPMPTVQTTPLRPTPQMPMIPVPTTTNVPQANAAGATPLFSLGQGMGMQQPQLPQPQNPLIQQQQQPQWFQEGGQVQPMTLASGQGPPSTQTYQNWQALASGAASGLNNPYNQANLLGAWALGPGTSMLTNPWPSGSPSDKSGVSPAGQPTAYQVGNAPGALVGNYQGPPVNYQGRTFTADQINALNPGDFQRMQQAGLLPGASQLPSQIASGPWATQPGVFVKAPMPTLNQPVGWGGLPTSPLTPTPQANAAQMPQMPVTPAANAATARATPLAQQPNTDRVPAMLTPGEFVVNREATAAMGPQNLARLNASAQPGVQAMPPAAPAAPPGLSSAFMEGFQHGFSGMPPRGPTAPPPAKMQTGGYVYPQDQQPQVLRMQGGGYVTPGSGYTTPVPYSGTVHDDPYISNAVSSLLGLPANPWHPAASPQDQPSRMQQQQGSQQPQTGSPGSAQGEDTSQGTSRGPAGSNYQQTIQNAIRAKQAQAYASAPNIGSLAGEQAYVTGEPVAGVGAAGVSGPGTGVPTLQAAGVASGIGSALTQASKDIAASTPPWRWITPASMGNQVAPPPAPVSLGQVRT
jgi:hypothetical protein